MSHPLVVALFPEPSVAAGAVRALHAAGITRDQISIISRTHDEESKLLPGIGPIVAAGPLAAGLSEAAGHAAGGIASALSGAGVEETRAEALEKAVEGGAVLVAVHTVPSEVATVRGLFETNGATDLETANWSQ